MNTRIQSDNFGPCQIILVKLFLHSLQLAFQKRDLLLSTAPVLIQMVDQIPRNNF